MFNNSDLKEYLTESNDASIYSLVLAEWNMNIVGNIKKIGNYKYRPLESESLYKSIPNTYDNLDSGDFYTDADISYSEIQNTYNPDDTLQAFQSLDKKRSLYYSLEDCTKPFRPRSGINKLMFFEDRYLPNNTKFGNNAPRYYMASRNDLFKYWTSYRKEGNVERGIANTTENGIHYISDACPFVIYNNSIPCNRLIFKMQTNTGKEEQTGFQTITGAMNDPFYGNLNKTIPSRFRIQVLKNNNWIDVFVANENTKREDGSDLIGADGYLELSYKNNTWSFNSEEINYETPFVTDLVNPIKTTNADGTFFYNEFEYIDGIRIVTTSMNKFDSSFDLIEFSPRLVVDISNKVLNFKINKTLSDLSQSAMPVGQLLASTGSIQIFDEEFAFNENNENSIIKDYLNKNIKFVFYENIFNNSHSIDYFVPIKTLYSDNFPQTSDDGSSVILNLRDFYFYLESNQAPRMLLTDVSLSFAISVLLDSIGFTNYTFKRFSGEKDPIIPYFFIAPEQTVAEVLNELAISTQTAMFFDEYNNLVIMSKNYIMPENNEREVSLELIGTNNQEKQGAIKNADSTNKLPNIISIASQDKQIYNDGKINYTSRYIQRSYSSLKQASLIDEAKTWIYKPALLWEASGDDVLKTINEGVAKQSNFVLGAMPLSSDLIDQPPTIQNGAIVNNIIDVGENIYWATRYKGYFYNNGEIIRYDAIQFSITGTGNVWISNNQEYQDYFSNLPFNGKMYPTGLIRIFCTPYYEVIDGETRFRDGDVLEHGRAQFGTEIAYHYADISSDWTSELYLKGCNMKASEYLFATSAELEIPLTYTGSAGIDNQTSKKSTRTGLIRNFMAGSYANESQMSKQSGSIQSSALVFTGPLFETGKTPLDFMSYVYKPLEASYKHFGTRMRIIGSVENSNDRIQTPVGSMTYYQIPGLQPNQTTNIGGGSGGIGVMVNPENNNGYYFEIVALTENNIQSYLNIKADGSSDYNIYNIVFYKVMRDESNNAIPVKLWSGLASILVDDGRFTGQYRFIGDDKPTVYDLAIEYSDIGTTRRFYLYLNDKVVGVVDDTNPLPAYNNIALFVRGSSKCMFENVYAIGSNYSQNTSFNVTGPIAEAFGGSQISASDSLRKYAMSGVVKVTYLNGISSLQPPQYNIFYEEFGSILREAAYFNIKYDKAYPALYAQLSPTPSKIKGYTVSGFQADSYGAEFLIFNATDSALSLDETTGNYLRIQGITFTQDTTYTLSVDDYFNKKSNFFDKENINELAVRSQLVSIQEYNKIKQSRMNHGIKSFTLETPYIQTSADAENILGWIINRSMKPKKLVGVNVFSMPILQLGDIVSINYEKNDVNLIADPETKFVIYNIEYERSSSGPNMTLYMAEV